MEIRDSNVAVISPVESQMRLRLRHELERVRTIELRLKELASVYNEYLDLRDEELRRKQRMGRIVALIGPHDWDAPLGTGIDQSAAAVMSVLTKTAEELRGSLPLWEAMREYLAYVPEARIAEMESFFSVIGFAEGNRQAIESALKRHPKVFRVRKQRREKYIALR